MNEEPIASTPLITTNSQLPQYTSDSGSSTGNGDDIDNSSGVSTNDDRSETERTKNVSSNKKVGDDYFSAASRSHHNTMTDEFSTTSRSQLLGNDSYVQTGKKKKKKKKKNKGILLNFDSAMELEYQVQINLIKHNLASMYFTNRQFWLFTIPQGVLTMVASVLAFVASSSLVGEVSKDIIATIVGSTSGVVVFLQTMGGVCNYGARAAMHGSAAIDLRDLRDEIVLIKFKVKKEEEQGVVVDRQSHLDDGASSKSSIKKGLPGTNQQEDEDSDSDSEDEEETKRVKEHDNTFARIQQRYRQSLSGCKSNAPMQLSEAFHGMHSNLLVSQSLDNHKVMVDVYGPKTNYRNIIHFKAFDILSSEILNYWGFPIFLPHSHRVVDRAMESLNKELTKYHTYWDNRLDEIIADHLRDVAAETADIPKHLRQSQIIGLV